MLKRFTLQLKIGLLMTLAVLLLLASGYLAYRRISSIVASIHLDARPDKKMAALRSIALDLERAENSVKMFDITRDESSLKPYYRIIARIKPKIDTLQAASVGDSVLQSQIDTISMLIGENIVVWNDMLTLYQDKTVDEYLALLAEKITANMDTSRNEEEGFIKKIFKQNPEKAYKEQELIDDLNRIEEHDTRRNQKLKAKASRLARTNIAIKERLYRLFSRMEEEVQESILLKSAAANKLATRTYLLLGLFTSVSTLLAILVLFIVERFVSKTRQTQKALEAAKTEAENLAKAKERFIASVSHEMRTPMNAIAGFTEQLLQDTPKGPNQHMLEIIKSSSDHLVEVINEILDFSKMQTAKLQLEKTHFSIVELALEIQAIFEVQARKNGNFISYGISPKVPPVLLGDPYRIKQILINLIGNAIKFTNHGEIYFSIDAEQKTTTKIVLILMVADTGIGIEKSKLEIIFDDFTQAEMSTTRKFGGTGLGLSIVKKLTILHGGTIELESNLNKGSVFTCRLPYLTGDASKIKSKVEFPSEIPYELKGKRALIADDVPFNRLLLKTILNRWGMLWFEVENGKEVIEQLNETTYDIVFMDLRMPVLDGFEATTFIRTELKGPNQKIPIIALSAAGTAEEVRKVEKSGMNDHLTKPFNEAQLLDKVLSVLKINTTGAVMKEKDNLSNSKNNSNKIVLNLKDIYRLAGNDTKFVRQMLVQFIESTERELNEIQKAGKNGQWDLIAESTHKILPPCRHVGANELFSTLKEIETNALTNKQIGDFELVLRTAKLEFESVKEFINEHLTNSL